MHLYNIRLTRPKLSTDVVCAVRCKHARAIPDALLNHVIQYVASRLGDHMFYEQVKAVCQS